MPVKSINLDLCNGCAVCADDCPTEVFKMSSDTGKAHLAYPQDCADCHLCPFMCSAGALNYSSDIGNKLFFPY